MRQSISCILITDHTPEQAPPSAPAHLQTDATCLVHRPRPGHVDAVAQLLQDGTALRMELDGMRARMLVGMEGCTDMQRRKVSALFLATCSLAQRRGLRNGQADAVQVQA